MARCDIIPLSAKACSGKCMGSCAPAMRTWVIAACGGMISLFEKTKDGHLSLLPQSGSAMVPSVEGFITAMETASRDRKFDQLVIVGSANDIAWMQMSMPAHVAKSIAAEIEYPLVSGWFKRNGDMRELTHALEHVFQH